ncbi:MAG: hypothetical protein MJ246_02080 [Clostridia bacterium]|nr:hypothetical protein [Clostridia bacterium]
MLFKRKDSSGIYLDGRFDCLLVFNGSYTKIFDFKRVYTNYANSNGFEFRDENGNNKYFSTAGY